MRNYLPLSILVVLFLNCLNNLKAANAESASGNTEVETDTTRLIDNYLTKLSVDKNFSGGLLIIKDDKKIFSKGYGWADKEKKISFTTGTLASMGSITKAFTAYKITMQKLLIVTIMH